MPTFKMTPKPKCYANDSATYNAFRTSYVREQQTLRTGALVTWWRDVIRDNANRIVWASLTRSLTRPSSYYHAHSYTRDALHRMRVRYYRQRMRGLAPSATDL